MRTILIIIAILVAIGITLWLVSKSVRKSPSIAIKGETPNETLVRIRGEKPMGIKTELEFQVSLDNYKINLNGAEYIKVYIKNYENSGGEELYEIRDKYTTDELNKYLDKLPKQGEKYVSFIPAEMIKIGGIKNGEVFAYFEFWNGSLKYEDTTFSNSNKELESIIYKFIKSRKKKIL